MNSSNLERYLDIIVEAGLRKRKGNLKFHTDTIFEGISFEGKNVIDIGGGTGIFSFYSAVMGAERVICLEPGGDGSSEGIYGKFKELYEKFGMNNVVLKREAIQDYDPFGDKFDIIISYNSINHLDETACMRLLYSDVHRDLYVRLFTKIYSMANEGAFFIICDCSRYNIFPLLGLKNPFAPTINWKKHHSPWMWSWLLGRAGFRDPQTMWLSHDRLRGLGKLLFGNRLVNFFYNSHFCLRVRR